MFTAKKEKYENKNFKIDYYSPAPVTALFGFIGDRVRKRTAGFILLSG
jgi:hypothetical protein